MNEAKAFTAGPASLENGTEAYIFEVTADLAHGKYRVGDTWRAHTWHLGLIKGVGKWEAHYSSKLDLMPNACDLA